MRHVAPVRRELGVTTIMNVLGPLTNPAGARRQVVGVADPKLVDLIANALQQLGHERALVVHGEPGLDEISPIGPSDVVELKDGELCRYTLDPVAVLGYNVMDAGELAGGDPEHNARTVLGVLRGELKGAARAAVVLNAGAALYLADRADTLATGVQVAERVLDTGGGLSALQRLRSATRAGVTGT
jgi:anthranilate phosphoribosyltransferase